VLAYIIAAMRKERKEGRGKREEVSFFIFRSSFFVFSFLLFPLFTFLTPQHHYILLTDADNRPFRAGAGARMAG